MTYFKLSASSEMWLELVVCMSAFLPRTVLTFKHKRICNYKYDIHEDYFLTRCVINIFSFEIVKPSHLKNVVDSSMFCL